MTFAWPFIWLFSRRGGAIVAIGTTIAAGGIIAGSIYQPNLPIGGGGAQTANLWVDTSGGTCTRSSTPAEYADASACASLGAAYSAASAGDSILIKAGTYASLQTLAFDDKGSSTNVTINVANGETVTLSGGMVINTSHVTLDGSGGTLALPNAFTVTPSGSAITDITLQHFNAFGTQSTVTDADDVTLNDLQLGGYCGVNPEDAILIAATGPSNHSTNVVLENSYIGQICLTGGGHPDCISLNGADNITVRKNRVADCGTQGLYATDDGDGGVTNLTAENNQFGPCSGCSNMLRLTDTTGATIRYNSFSLGVGGAMTTSTGILFYGNITDFNNFGCESSGVTYSYNLFDGGTCAGTDTNGTPGYVDDSTDPDTFDLHLSSSSSPAVDAGDTANYPATDFDGVTRYLGSAPDAGAFEKG